MLGLVTKNKQETKERRLSLASFFFNSSLVYSMEFYLVF